MKATHTVKVNFLQNRMQSCQPNSQGPLGGKVGEEPGNKVGTSLLSLVLGRCCSI